MNIRVLAAIFVIFLTTTSWAVTFQEIDKLLNSNQIKEAHLEITKWLEKEPGNVEALRRLGYVYFFRAEATQDEEAAKNFRKMARATLVRARELGDRDELANSLIQSTAKDGSPGSRFSSNPEAEQAMKTGERHFSNREYASAQRMYHKASVLDPMIYQAPLYEGDALLQLRKFTDAHRAYQRAIEINPNRETAYRYWGDAYLRSNEPEQALEKYAKAIVAEPFSELAWKRGLLKWGKHTDTKIKLPKVKRAASLGKNGQIIISDAATTRLAPWLAYATNLALWRNTTFAERYPGKAYRPTLAEEVESLAAAAQVAMELEAQGNFSLDDDLRLLAALKKDNLLEPFAFFSRQNQSIIDDYRAYRENNRDKITRFLVEYAVIRETF